VPLGKQPTRRWWSARRTAAHRRLPPAVRLPAAAAVAALLGWAAVLRMWRLGAVGFSGDEAVYAGQAAVLAHVHGMGRWFIEASRGNSNFLATQWLISLVYRVFGVSDWGARLVSAVASVLTVLLVYLLARQLYGGRRYALGAALVMAASGYAILLGRLALLDATACFFLTAAMYCVARWMRTGGLGWAVLGAVAESFAVQAKVTSALIVVVATALLAITGLWRRLRPLHVLVVVLSALVASIPALLQLLSNTSGVRGFLAASTARTTDVPWDYYPSVLWSSEGPVLFVFLLIAVGVALVRRQRANLLPIVWLGVYAIFLQLYPLKGFNYLLPLMPPLALLGGRLLGEVVTWVASRWRLRAPTVLAAVAAVLVGSQFAAVEAAVANDRSAGMREAALWLRAHGAQRAGAIALSHGSGQYVLPFYGGVDAYPYGRFRIATVMPGGRVVNSHPRRDGDVPLDWVNEWPGRLIAEGRVHYLVYQTKPLDDPPEQSQVAGTITMKQFRSFIAHYGGRLVHAVYWNHEARVYVYRVTRRLPRPVLTATAAGAFRANGSRPNLAFPVAAAEKFVVKARGFTFGSPLTVSYGPRIVGRAVADADGTAEATVRVPLADEARYHLIVSDGTGLSAAVTAVAPAWLTYSVERRVVHASGTGFRPGRPIKLSYRHRQIGLSRARPDGTVSWVFRLRADSPPHPRVFAAGPGGRAAVTSGLVSPQLAFSARGATARITGRDYSPDSRVTLTYANRSVGVTQTDSRGRFAYVLTLPTWTRPGYRLVATDPVGLAATVTGLVRR
jgi:Dolichyl-phosphate-mannose-protein mannosyltransferase